MKNIWEFCKAKYVYLICFIHFLVSCIWSRFFFISIRENTGSENIAYKFKNTGITLETDTLSRALCWTYSHILAILIIAAFWNWIFFLTRSWRNSVVKKKIYRAFVCIYRHGNSTDYGIISVYSHNTAGYTMELCLRKGMAADVLAWLFDQCGSLRLPFGVSPSDCHVNHTFLIRHKCNCLFYVSYRYQICKKA